MPARLPDEERQRIIDLLPSGKSCNQIAREVGHSANTVSRIAKEQGHAWGRANLARALEARETYGAEWRAQFAKKLSAKAEELLADMNTECLVYNFGGKDNTYAERLLPAPPHGDRFKLMQAARLAIQTVLDIARHDSDGGMGLPAVDEWLATVRGTKA